MLKYKDYSKKLQALIRLRTKEMDGDIKILPTDFVRELFVWKTTKEGLRFWSDVQNGVIPKEYQ